MADSQAVTTQAMSCLEVWGGNEPVDTALRVPGLDVWVYAVPFENAAAGGDVHFVSSCGFGRIARLMVADVAGHGQLVAQTAQRLRGLIRRYMNHIDQRKVIVAMNEEFTRLGEEGRFATAVMMTYFSPLNELSVCNAGHPPPLIYTKATKAWRYLETRAVAGHDDIENIPLGILADAGYEQFGVELAQGDLVLCYTDSLVEAVCRDKTLLGTQRLLDMVGTVNAAEPAHVIHHLLAKLTVYGAALNDDVTVLVAHCTGPAKGAGLFARLGAQLKFLGQVATFRRNIPWPELSMRNVGGLVSQRLSKRAK